MAQSKAQQEQIVQRMIDAGESEDNIALVIKSFKTPTPKVSAIAESTKAADVPDDPNEPEARSLYEHIFKAPEVVTNVASEFSKSITEPRLDESPWLARAKGFVGGAAEGLASQLSPANLLTFGRGRIPQLAAQILGGAQVAHGGQELYEGNTAEGIGDIAFGALGLSAPRMAEAKPAVAAGRPSKLLMSSGEVVEPSGRLNDISEMIARPITTEPRPPGPWDANTSVERRVTTGEAPAGMPERRASDEKLIKFQSDRMIDEKRQDELLKKLGGKQEEFDPSTLKFEPKPKMDKDVTLMPEGSKPTATFLALGEDSKPLFNVKGGPRDQSTVTLDTLNELGIEAPEVPAGAKPIKGDELRKQMQTSRSAAMDAKNKGFKGTVPDEAPVDISQVRGEDQPKIAKLQEINKIPKMANESQKKSAWAEVRDANRALLTSFDFSAAGRQGKPLMLTKAYWTSFDDMFKSWGSQRAYDNVMESITQYPNFKKPIVDGVPTGKSLAERAGLNYLGKEEQFQSNIAEKFIPGVKASERAYTAFLSKLRADHFNTMIEDARRMGMNPDANDHVLKQIGGFINDATGRGSLGKLEHGPAVKALNEVFFAPRLMASRVNMYKRWLNPMTYTNENPVVRQQALKSLLSTVGFGLAAGELARLGGAQVNNDPTSSDFRKIRVSDKTRIDPFSGFQQYAVGASRLLSGETTGSSKKMGQSGKSYDLTNGKFGMPTRASVVSQFAQNKLAPIPSLVWSWMEGKDWDGQPFDIKQAVLDRTVPIVMQDLMDLAKDDPKLLPLGVLPIMGEGLQTYGR